MEGALDALILVGDVSAAFDDISHYFALLTLGHLLLDGTYHFLYHFHSLCEMSVFFDCKHEI
jgi:hypothetical protein